MLPNRLETINSPTYKRSIADYIYPDGKGRPLDGGVFRCPSADDKKKSSLGASLGTAGPGYNYLSYGRNNSLALGAAADNPTYRVAQIGNPSKRMLAIESNTWNFAPDNQGNIETRFAPRHRTAPTPVNPLGEMAHILFIDGHVEARLMSMNPIDLAEWSELGTSGSKSNMGQ
jgi:prepilin-type processing-associated H-X9-DG protein